MAKSITPESMKHLFDLHNCPGCQPRRDWQQWLRDSDGATQLLVRHPMDNSKSDLKSGHEFPGKIQISGNLLRLMLVRGRSIPEVRARTRSTTHFSAAGWG